MTKPIPVIFITTDVCDKRCPSCCTQSMRKGRVMDFERYLGRLSQAADYCKRRGLQPLIAFTGGEAFYYFNRGSNGKMHTLPELVDSALSVMPNARIIIKTSGFKKHGYLDNLLNTILTTVPKEQLLFRLGFSLHQNKGLGALERITHIVDTILAHHSKMDIDVIYDKTLMTRTFEVLSAALTKSGFNASLETSWSRVFSEPLKSHGTEFSASGKTVHVATDPAYRPDGCADALEYYQGAFNRSCPAFTGWSPSICYRPDFEIVHCNDPYMDFGAVPLSPGRPANIKDEIEYLQARYDALRPIMAGMDFKTKREACKFCSEFISGKNKQNPI